MLREERLLRIGEMSLYSIIIVPLFLAILVDSQQGNTTCTVPIHIPQSYAIILQEEACSVLASNLLASCPRPPRFARIALARPAHRAKISLKDRYPNFTSERSLPIQLRAPLPGGTLPPSLSTVLRVVDALCEQLSRRCWIRLRC